MDNAKFFPFVLKCCIEQSKYYCLKAYCDVKYGMNVAELQEQNPINYREILKQQLRPFKIANSNFIYFLAKNSPNLLDKKRLIQKGFHAWSCAIRAIEFTTDEEGRPRKIEQIKRLQGSLDGETVWKPLLMALIMLLHEGGGALEIYLLGQGGHENVGQFHSNLSGNVVKKILAGQVNDLFSDQVQNKQIINSVEKSDLLKILDDHHIDQDEIIEPLMVHGIKDYYGINPYALLCKDEDKLDTQIRTSASEFAFNRWISRIDRVADGKPSPTVVNELLSGHLVSNRNVATKIDWLLKTIAWATDINFTTNKVTWRTLIFPRQMALLKKLLIPYPEDHNLINEVFNIIDSTVPKY